MSYNPLVDPAITVLGLALKQNKQEKILVSRLVSENTKLYLTTVGCVLFHETWAFNICIHVHAYILILRFDAHNVWVLGRNVWMLWPPDAKSRLTEKDSGAGKD